MDWFKAENISTAQEMQFIEPIKLGMLVPNLNTMSDYIDGLKNLGMKILIAENISEKVSKTWDVTFDMIQKPSLWKLALRGGADFIGFLKAFRAMQKGYKTKSLVYGIIIAEKTY